MLNNSSVSRLSFVVSDDASSGDVSVICTKNPAWDKTTFIITQSMIGADMDVLMEVFDLSGRQLYKREVERPPMVLMCSTGTSLSVAVPS